MKKITLIRNAILLAFGFCLSSLQAAPPSPESLRPPTENPHPPQSLAEKKRVAFAEAAVRQMLMQKLPDDAQKTADFSFSKAVPLNVDSKNLDCLKTVRCFAADFNFVRNLNDIQRSLGVVTEMRHAHVIPWSWEHFQKLPRNAKIPVQPPAEISAGFMAVDVPQLKPDEYMVHIYAKFSEGKSGEGWYHLDVVLTEDESGNVYLRYFKAWPISGPGLPPGMVC